MSVFQLELPFEPAGVQPGEIGALTSGLVRRERYETLPGVSGFVKGVSKPPTTGGWTPVATASAGTTSTFASLTPGTTHTYTVTPIDSDGKESPRPAPVTITTSAPPTRTPRLPDTAATHAAAGAQLT